MGKMRPIEALGYIIGAGQDGKTVIRVNKFLRVAAAVISLLLAIG
jgi:hypothetical protein